MIPIRKETVMTASPGVLSVGGASARRIQAELGASLTQQEYEAWLLPPEPRDGIERFVHTLSLGAGVIAVTIVTAGLWLAT